MDIRAKRNGMFRPLTRHIVDVGRSLLIFRIHRHKRLSPRNRFIDIPVLSFLIYISQIHYPDSRSLPFFPTLFNANLLTLACSSVPFKRHISKLWRHHFLKINLLTATRSHELCTSRDTIVIIIIMIINALPVTITGGACPQIALITQIIYNA